MQAVPSFTDSYPISYPITSGSVDENAPGPKMVEFIKKIEEMNRLLQQALDKFGQRKFKKCQSKFKKAQGINSSEKGWSDFDKLLEVEINKGSKKLAAIIKIYNNVPNENSEYQKRGELPSSDVLFATRCNVLTQSQEITCKTGKTELAVHYARNFNGTVIWVDYKEGLEISNKFEHLEIESVEDLLSWIADSNKKLLVLNDVPSIETVKNFLDDKILGNVLVTTRNCNIEIEGVKIIQVGVFTPEDAKNYLEVRTGVFNPEIPTLAYLLGYVPGQLKELADFVSGGIIGLAGLNSRASKRIRGGVLDHKSNVVVQPKFLLRPIDVQAVKERLDASAAYAQVVLFSEEVGVGKKWIAHEAVLERVAQYDLIWRFPCSQNAEIFWEFYLSLARKLGIKEVDLTKEALIEEVKEKLTKKSFAIILEDALDDRLLAEFFPQISTLVDAPKKSKDLNNSVYVLTTHNREWAQSQENSLLIHAPSQEENLRYLTKELEKTKLTLDGIPQQLFNHPFLIQIFCYCLTREKDSGKVVLPLLEKATSARELFCHLWDTVLKDQEKKLPAIVLPEKKLLDPLMRFCLNQNGIIEKEAYNSWVRKGKFDLPEFILEEIVDQRISLLVDFQMILPFRENRMSLKYVVNPVVKSWLEGKDNH